MDDILVGNYDVFEYMAQRSSNPFKNETATAPKIFPCGSECTENGISILELYAKITYEGVADSGELFLDFEYTQGDAIFDMKFHNVSRIEYDQYLQNPLAKLVNYLPEDTHEFGEHVKISTDLGTIQRET